MAANMFNFLKQRRLILIVDDVKYERNLLIKALSRVRNTRYQVLEASSKKEAFQHIADYGKTIDALIIDVNLNNSDLNNTEGLKIADTMRAFPTILITQQNQNPVSTGIVSDLSAHRKNFTFIAKTDIDYLEKMPPILEELINESYNAPDIALNNIQPSLVRQRRKIEVDEGVGLIVAAIIAGIFLIIGNLMGANKDNSEIPDVFKTQVVETYQYSLMETSAASTSIAVTATAFAKKEGTTPINLPFTDTAEPTLDQFQSPDS